MNIRTLTNYICGSGITPTEKKEIIGGIISGIASHNANKLNKENLEFQKEQWEYNKQLQQTIFQREDNATQRAAADLEAAGLSKTLAAGSGAGAGAVVAQTAPQNDIAATIAPQLEIAKIQQNMMSEAVTQAMNFKKMEADIRTQERQENRADLMAGITATVESWKMGMGERQFEHTLNQFENVKNYQEFEKLMSEKYYEIDKGNADMTTELQRTTLDEMKKWLEFGDDEEHRKLPKEIKMWMWQYKQTHSWENVGWNVIDKITSAGANALEAWASPGGIFRGLMPTPSERPFNFGFKPRKR